MKLDFLNITLLLFSRPMVGQSVDFLEKLKNFDFALDNWN